MRMDLDKKNTCGQRLFYEFFPKRLGIFLCWFAMNKINREITRYKAIMVAVVLCAFIVFAATMSLETISIGTKIIFGIIFFIVNFIIAAIYHTKTNSFSCPSCGKPVIIQRRWYDQSGLLEGSVDNCYFCGHRFE